MTGVESGSLSKTVSLADIAKSLAGPDNQYNYFHGKIYSFLAPSTDQVLQFLAAIKSIRAAAPSHQPVDILIGDFSPLIKHQVNLVPAVKDGNLTLLYEITERKLPSCPYFAIITAAQKTDNSTGYANAYQTINFVRALLTLHFGKLLFYEWIADFDFDLEGKPSFAGEAFRMPLYADVFKILDTKLASDILERLSLQQTFFQEQFYRACNFISAAMNQKDEAFRFSSYWIALEILAQGTSGAIRARLAQAYGNISNTSLRKA